MRHIDILYCDPLTPDNSNQWDEWEAKVRVHSEVCVYERTCVCEEDREGERESSARELLRSTKKKVHKKRQEGSIFMC